MNRWILALALALSLTAPMVAQDAASAGGAAEQAGPQPKTQEELDALMAIQNAAGPQERADAADKLLKDFPETEFTEFANYMQMLAYMEMNDFENMVIFGERTLEINPENVGVLLQLASTIPTRVGTFDLDKEEKLGKAEDFAGKAINLVPNLAKMDPDMTDDQWLLVKKDFMGQANEALGLVAAKRDDHEKAVELLTKSLTLASQQSSQTFYFLADSYQKLGKKDEGLNAINKTLELGNFPTSLAEDLKKKLEAM